MKTNIKNYTNDQLINRVESLSTFKGWKKGIYDIWLRSEEDEYNKFDDKVYTFECLKDNTKPIFIMVCTGTTNAGSQGLKNFEKYNAKGCAVLCDDIIIYDSHIYGPHGKSKYPAYIQSFTVGFPYTRDNDKDNNVENYGTIYDDRIVANCHKAGVASENINGNSVACLVRNVLKEFEKWMKFMNKRKLSVAILKEF